MENRKKNIRFNTLAIILIIIISVTLTPITFQNDTYYTIKVGESILNNGIDMQDHFSWHENLSYTYPHWLYDVITYLVYSKFNFFGVYILTCIFSSILGITLYITNSKICKNNILSFFVTFFIMFLIKNFIAARAQLVTFILFVLTIYLIERYLETSKIKYSLGLILIPILIANMHIAVFPFYFILYLPYIAEYIVSILYYDLPFTNFKIRKLKKKLLGSKIDDKEKDKIEKCLKKYENIIESRKNKIFYNKVIITKNKNVKKLIIVMFITLFTGFLSPLGINSYTYLIKTMIGNTTQYISEHSAITFANFPEALIFITIIILLLAFTKVKIKLSDIFLISGLTILTIFSQRQFSMLALLGSFVLSKIIYDIISSNKNNVLREDVTKVEALLFIILTLMLSVCLVREKYKEKFVDENQYPVKAADYILENVDLTKSRFYNEYDYGSYMIFRGIPVFIDSRADLYDPKFSKKENDIFMDYIRTNNILVFYEDTFEKYKITHIIIKKDSKLDIIISNTDNKKYNELYSDENFVIYEIVK